MDRIRVLYLAPLRARADQMTLLSFVDEEIGALADRGVEPFLITLPMDGQPLPGGVHGIPVLSKKRIGQYPGLFSFVKKHWALVRRAPIRKGEDLRDAVHALRMEQFISSVARREGIDLLHSHFGWPGGFGGVLAGLETSTPVVCTMHGMDVLLDPSIGYGQRQSPFFEGALRVSLGSADHTIYVSNFIYRQAVPLGAVSERSSVIDRGVNLQRFRPPAETARLREQLGISTPHMILTVGRLIPRKGIDDILRALALLERRDFTLVVCGEGEGLSELRNLSRQAGLENHVRFSGWVGRQRIADFFSACDLFVLGSRLEALGNVLLEAMACGKPVVCTDSGGPPEVVAHQRTGFVVPVRDSWAMSRRIGELLASSDLRENFGIQARRLVESRFSYERMIRETFSVYESVLRRRSSRGRPGRELAVSPAKEG